MIKKMSTIAGAMALGAVSYAQPDKPGAWYSYFGSQQLNNTNWNWHNELQYRNFNAVGDLEQLLLRTGIGYNLTPGNNNILFGYGFIHGRPYLKAGFDERITVNEHRLFQQFITRQSISRVNVQHRYRFEQRFLPDNFKLRFRYLLGLTVPVNKAKMDAKAFYVSAYNEIFIHTDGNLFDRNRSFAGVGYVIKKELRFDVGFMRQMLAQDSRNQVMISLYNNLPVNFN
ncbi:MAG: DUF2490 domain-containing protein [Sphingobacteriales bacterium]|nr:MAG: DUF2490 domain-containing protein [Sphingobacteriales bacterium]